MSWPSDELTGATTEVRPRRLDAGSAIAGQYKSPTIEQYTLFVLTNILVTIENPFTSAENSFWLQPEQTQLWVLVDPGQRPETFTWTGWVPMEAGDYLSYQFGESLSFVVSGITYPNNL